MCTGSPFLDPYKTNSAHEEVERIDNGKKQTAYKYGFESWCNLQGRYTSFVIDFPWLAANFNGFVLENEYSICQVGIFGTKYVRETPAPTAVSLDSGTTTSLTIQMLRSKFAIGNTLDIHLRQKPGDSVLSWVSFEQGSPNTNVIVDASNVKPGTYTLTIESFDNNGKVRSTLETDSIEITVSEGCLLDAIVDSQIGNGLVDKSIEFKAQAGKEIIKEASYADRLDFVKSTLGFDESKLERCGGLLIEMVFQEKFLTHESAQLKIIMTSKKDQQASVFTNSYIQVTMDKLSWRIPIKVTFEACLVSKLSFLKSSAAVTYMIESAGLQIVPIPKVTQDPDCNKSFDKFEILSVSTKKVAPDQIRSIFSIDSAAKALQFATDNKLFEGEEVKVTIGILQDSVVDASEFEVKIQFLAADPTTSAEENEDSVVEQEEVDTVKVNQSEDPPQETQ